MSEMPVPEKIIDDAVFGLQVIAAEIERINRANGWYEDERDFGMDIALLHSEVSEALEAYRDFHDFEPHPNHAKGLVDATVDDPDDPTAPLVPKPDGVPSELADVLIRLLDTVDRIGLGAEGLIDATIEKLSYNSLRGYKHGGKAV